MFIRTILHPTDFSPHSENALQLACALARDYDARLVVLHAEKVPPAVYGSEALPLDPEVTYREARKHLNEIVIPDAEIHVERRFEEGDPIPTILHIAGEIDADLIVLGTHGRTGLKRFLMGSVAEQIVRRARCPVLTVTGDARIEHAGVGAAKSEDWVAEASEESFPASDAPGWIGGPG